MSKEKLAQNNKNPEQATQRIVGLFMLLIIVAEAVVTWIGVIPGLIFHAVLVLALFNGYAFAEHSPCREALVILSLAPLMRFISLSMPITNVPQMFWYGLIGAPVLIAAIMIARMTGVSGKSLKWVRTDWQRQALIAASGIPLGLAAFYIFRTTPLLSYGTPAWAAVLAVITLVLFSAFTEEFIFRYLLQQITVKLFNRFGISIGAIFYAALFLGTNSLAFIIYMGLIGLFFGLWVEQSGSLWGVVVSHSLFSIGLLIVWPVVLA